jgi:hypothetical protein
MSKHGIGADAGRPRSTAALSAAVLLMAATASAGKVYSIQLGAYANAADARSALADIVSTCSRAFVRETGDTSGFPCKVAAGRFASYAEAWVYKSRLAGAGADKCFITSAEDEGVEPVQSVLPVIYPFDTDGLDAPEPLNATEYWRAGGFSQPDSVSSADAGLMLPDYSKVQTLETEVSTGLECATDEELLAVGLSAPGNPDATVCLELYLATSPTAPASNRARLCLARALGRGSDFELAESLLAGVRASGSQPERVMADFLSAHVKNNRKQRGEAWHGFRSVANNRKAPPSLRREAMLRAANVAHAMQNYPDAWLAFEQVERKARDSATAAEARMQRAGLAFELVGRGKGTWEEVRELCRSVEDFEGAPRKVLATAGLMHLETFFEQGRMNEALMEIRAFVVNYQDIPREYYLARVWEGIVLHKLGHDVEAQFILDTVMNTRLPASEKFAATDTQARAAVWVAAIAQSRGDLATRDRAIELLQRLYPESEETRRAIGFRGGR